MYFLEMTRSKVYIVNMATAISDSMIFLHFDIKIMTTLSLFRIVFSVFFFTYFDGLTEMRN